MILLAPNPTGSGHNMRALALGRHLVRDFGQPVTVALASLQSTFTPLFKKSGIEVIDISGRLVDYSSESHLELDLGWNSYIGGYIANTFVSGERVLNYLFLYEELEPKSVVTDYNIAAGIAATVAGVPHVCVTERYDFTLCQVDDSTLAAGGFVVHRDELARARRALHKLFGWVIDQSHLVLTDKPPLPELDAGTPVIGAIKSGRGHFVGPMIRDIPCAEEDGCVTEALGLGDSPFLVASVSGTTMFVENKRRLLEAYLEAYSLLRRRNPNLKLVLLGRQDIDVIDVPDGVVTLPYLPEWMHLLRRATALLSAPGWITVTEVCSLGIPTLFILPSYAEYHEAEALQRLHLLGLPTYCGTSAQVLADLVGELLDNPSTRENWLNGHAAVASPDAHGAARAASLICSVLP